MLILSDDDFSKIITITNLFFNNFLNYINNSFLNILPTSIKFILALGILSLIFFILLVLLAICISLIYHFIMFLFKKNKNETISKTFKKAIFFVIEKIKNPNNETVSNELIHFVLPIICFFILFLSGWKAILPILTYWIISSKYFRRKFNYQINPWLDGFFTIMILFYCLLILKSITL